MAYGGYFPATYQPSYYGNMNQMNMNPYYQQMQNPALMQQNQQAQQQAQQQMQQQTIQQSGFVLVQSEQEARGYPVAPGNSITFKDERLPYCYVKTMGFNQLDQPIFERYRLVKEESPSSVAQSAGSGGNQINSDIYATKDQLETVWAELNELKAQLKGCAEKKPVKAKKVAEKEYVNNEQ